IAKCADDASGICCEFLTVLSETIVQCYLLRGRPRRRPSAEMNTEELSNGNDTFRVMADAAPVMIWMSGRDMLCTFFNRPWLEFTGRTIEQELGNGWVASVFPDDRQQCLDTYVSSFRARRPFTMEYRLKRADGAYRWVLDKGIPRHGPSGAFS